MSRTMDIESKSVAGDDGDDSLHAQGGAFARLGRWTATHLRLVLLGWFVVLVVFGAFAPTVETELTNSAENFM